jgi:hypothetical protein
MTLRLALLLLACACVAPTYTYSFDLTDPGAHNLPKPSDRDSIEDADLRSEVLLDPVNFQAVLLDLTNKTGDELSIDWRRVAMVMPDHLQLELHPDGPVAPIQPGGRVVVRLVTFTLPTVGDSAARLDNQDFELVLPLMVRGVPREQRYHLRSHAIKQ